MRLLGKNWDCVRLFNTKEPAFSRLSVISQIRYQYLLIFLDVFFSNSVILISIFLIFL